MSARWTAHANLVDDSASIFEIAGVLAITVRDGRITRVRDYMDVLGLAHRTGRLVRLAHHLSGQDAAAEA